MSTLNTELEIQILGIIAESQAEGGDPIVAPNYGAAKTVILNRLGYICNKRSKAAHVMKTMRSKNLIYRLDGNTWGFGTEAAARSRCKELKNELTDSSDTSVRSTLSNILSGLTAPPAVATA